MSNKATHPGTDPSKRTGFRPTQQSGPFEIPWRAWVGPVLLARLGHTPAEWYAAALTLPRRVHVYRRSCEPRSRLRE